MQVSWEMELQPTALHMELAPAFRWFRSQGIELGRFAEEQLQMLRSQYAQGLITNEQHLYGVQAFSKGKVRRNALIYRYIKKIVKTMTSRSESPFSIDRHRKD